MRHNAIEAVENVGPIERDAGAALLAVEENVGIHAWSVVRRAWSVDREGPVSKLTGPSSLLARAAQNALRSSHNAPRSALYELVLRRNACREVERVGIAAD